MEDRLHMSLQGKRAPSAGTTAAADAPPAGRTAARSGPSGEGVPCARSGWRPPEGSRGARAQPAVLAAAGWGGVRRGAAGRGRGPLPQCAPPPRPGRPDGERGRRARAGCACAPAPGAIKASPPAATSASSCPEQPIHLLQRRLLWTWTLRPALALLVVPVPAMAPASVRDANAPPARRAAAPAALQNVRNAPRIVCAKAEKGQKLRPRSVAAASEDMRLPMNQV
ncbi:transcription initiation factor TFIID subunit 4 [Canis lupus familiaris]|uniref:transcription initiation factor TFIID subunit 4 n=1 Tax=Canis lupus familiaris TaxID=9615 RepID=UPI0015F174C6|nr:transcription initiation factor TFIID subunit 4 [Canis lupus familiaris]XP_038385515.1 transcription initiation factor TFIID subunit 4 [Canis lupus familiaris]XP_038513825.1 transcription initiation factor TFIID subunit 4 [Canis lupus familiaris]